MPATGKSGACGQCQALTSAVQCLQFDLLRALELDEAHRRVTASVIAAASIRSFLFDLT